MKGQAVLSPYSEEWPRTSIILMAGLVKTGIKEKSLLSSFCPPTHEVLTASSVC